MVLVLVLRTLGRVYVDTTKKKKKKLIYIQVMTTRTPNPVPGIHVE
jgi:hypothetical protein